MIQFLIGLLVGVFTCIFASAIASGEDDEMSEDFCRECPYKLFDDGSHDCARCHENVTS